MPVSRLFSLPVLLILLLLPLGATASPATVVTSGGRLHLAQGPSFPPVKLRGYGTLAGSLMIAPGASIPITVGPARISPSVAASPALKPAIAPAVVNRPQ